MRTVGVTLVAALAASCFWGVEGVGEEGITVQSHGALKSVEEQSAWAGGEAGIGGEGDDMTEMGELVDASPVEGVDNMGEAINRPSFIKRNKVAAIAVATVAITVIGVGLTLLYYFVIRNKLSSRKRTSDSTKEKVSNEMSGDVAAALSKTTPSKQSGVSTSTIQPTESDSDVDVVLNKIETNLTNVITDKSTIASVNTILRMELKKLNKDNNLFLSNTVSVDSVDVTDKFIDDVCKAMESSEKAVSGLVAHVSAKAVLGDERLFTRQRAAKTDPAQPELPTAGGSSATTEGSEATGTV